MSRVPKHRQPMLIRWWPWILFAGLMGNGAGAGALWLHDAGDPLARFELGMTSAENIDLDELYRQADYLLKNPGFESHGHLLRNANRSLWSWRTVWSTSCDMTKHSKLWQRSRKRRNRYRSLHNVTRPLGTLMKLSWKRMQRSVWIRKIVLPSLLRLPSCLNMITQRPLCRSLKRPHRPIKVTLISCSS